MRPWPKHCSSFQWCLNTKSWSTKELQQWASKKICQTIGLTDMVLQSPSKKLRSGVRKVAAEVWRNSRSAPPSLFWYSPTVIRVLPTISPICKYVLQKTHKILLNVTWCSRISRFSYNLAVEHNTSGVWLKANLGPKFKGLFHGAFPATHQNQSKTFWVIFWW